MKRKVISSARAGIVVVLMVVAIAGALGGEIIPSMLSGKSAEAAQFSLSAVGPGKQQAQPLTSVGSGFTYQGSLKSGGNPANGNYDLAFHLFDDPSAGSQVGTPITVTQVVTAGLFTVAIDFGPTAFDGNGRWMEIGVRQSGGGGYTTLAPRQPITPAPYALFALKTQPYKNVVVVAKSGGQFTTITSALNSITDASSTNHYLVYIAPGVYTESVTMKQWVDIEGAGQQSTKITFTGSSGFSTGTVVGASNAELRSLTVENTGGNSYANAIYNSGASPSLLHVTASAFGSTNNFGVTNTSSSPNMTNVTASGSGGSTNWGLYNENSSTNMTNVTISVSGPASSSNYGVYNGNSSTNMTNVTISVSGPAGSTSFGVVSSGSTVTIGSSKIGGSTNSIYSSATTTRVEASQLSGGPVNNNSGGTLTCSASYDANNKRLGADCTRNTKVAIVGITDGDYTSITAALNDIATWCGTPSATNKCLVRVGSGTYSGQVTMQQYVDIEGSGEQQTKITFAGSPAQNTGTVVGASNAELRSLTVENTGGDNYATAIYNSGTSPSLRNVTVLASGASGMSCGVIDFASSSPIMTNVTASVTGASDNRGVLNDSSSARITGSNISASGGTYGFGVSSYTSGTVTIDSSKITGFTNTVYNSAATTRVGASQLSGGPVNNNSGGTLSCSASYDENYVSPGLNVCP